MKVIVLREQAKSFETKDGTKISGKTITLLNENLTIKDVFLTAEKESAVGYKPSMISNPFADDEVNICEAEFVPGFNDKMKLAKIEE